MAVALSRPLLALRRWMRALLPAILLGCLPSPRGRCVRDADCGGGPAGLFCAEGVCQAPPAIRVSVPPAIHARADVAPVRISIDRAHGGPAATLVRLEVSATVLESVREGAGAVLIEVPLSLAPEGAEGKLPIRIVATDDLGHETVALESIAFDDAGPAIAIDADPRWHPRGTISVRANVQDFSGLNEGSIVLQLGAASLRPTSTAGALRTFDVPASLIPAGLEGPLAFEVRAQDTLGHPAKATGTLLIDDRAPRLSIVAATVPTAPVKRGTQVRIAATVEDGSPITLTAMLEGGGSIPTVDKGGGAYEVAVDTRAIAANASLAKISVSAVDAAGNRKAIDVSFGVTRVAWTSMACTPPVVGVLRLSNSVFTQCGNGSATTRAPATGLAMGGFSFPATVTLPPVASTNAVHVLVTTGSLCSAGFDGSNIECCPGFPPITSQMAVGLFPEAPQVSPEAVILAADSGTGGRRLYAVRKKGTSCDVQASLVLPPFFQSSVAIAASGLIYAAAQQAIVVARFDGLAWDTAVTSRPGAFYRSPIALLAANAASQPVLFGTKEGLLEDLVFPPPSTSTSLPGAATSAFATQASSASGYAVVGTTVAADGTITVATEDTRIVALDPRGNVKWTALLPARPTAAPTHGADGTLYAVDESGTMTALSAADGSVRWTFKASSGLRVPPALACDGTLYLGGDDGTVYALVSDSPGLADSPWPRTGRDNRGTSDMRRPLRSSDGTCLE